VRAAPQASRRRHSGARAAVNVMVALDRLSPFRGTCCAMTFATAPAIEVQGLTFRYPGDERVVLERVELEVPRGARCLLIGANGAGKTTLLQILAGKYMLPEASVRVLGRAAFHDTTLTADRAFLGGLFPLDIDLGVDEILARASDVDPARRDRLIRVLDVDTRWRMHRVSDGQRRRVQILLGLLRPVSVLLLDEVTTDLDVIARADLLDFLREECEQRGMTIVYATHIFDGLDRWATHLCHIARGRVDTMAPIDAIDELSSLRAAGVSSPLHRLVETWLRRDLNSR
jgi:CCR4-NOT complex subunit CAF16